LVLTSLTTAMPVEEALRTAECRVHIVRTIPDAVDFIKTNQPQAVLVDVTISETAAAAFLTEARTVMHLELPVLAICPSARETDRQRWIDLGFSGVLQTTCGASEVLDMVRRINITKRTSARPA